MAKKSFSILQEFLDHLDFSDIAQQIESLKEIIYSPPENDQAKIQSLKEEIAADRYQINSTMIAACMLEFANLEAEAV